jgi:hypothetical protein
VPKLYQVLPPTAPVPAPNDVLETLVREGARKMLQAVLEEEIDEFLTPATVLCWNAATERQKFRGDALRFPRM